MVGGISKQIYLPNELAGNKALYVTALQNQIDIFSPDGTMPSDGPSFTLGYEQQTDQNVKGKPIDVNQTFTHTFVTKATS